MFDDVLDLVCDIELMTFDEIQNQGQSVNFGSEGSWRS